MNPGVLPRSRTPFFGRRPALRRIEGLLGEHRLVTLTGVGGAGKSRLALRLAEDVVHELADEVGWVELAPLADERLVASAVCASMGVRLQAGISPADALSARLKESRALIVMDNCEHVLDGCAELVTELLDRCPRARILATSRAPLGLEGEMLWPVLGLSVPSTDSSSDPGASRAADAESVQLFVDRVRATRPGFELTPENLEAVIRLCRSLEGIPLAIELAAARARVLAPGQIARRLDEGIEVLSQAGRGISSRHRTMRATLDWSHDLLRDEERVLFRRLGVFGGDASIEAVEVVCADDPLERNEVLDVLGRLVDHSLLTVHDRGGAASYRLLEPVRHFAVERLEESGELEALRRRHADYFVDFAAGEAPGLFGPDRAESLERLEAEHDDLRRAWDHAASTGDGEVLGHLVRTLFWFWNFGGHFDEGRRRSDAALERLPSEGDGYAELLWASGALAWMQGDYDVARSRLEKCVTRCREDGFDDLLPWALREFAGVQLALGDLQAASDLYEESVALLAAKGRSWDEALALVVWADVRQALGDTAVAGELRKRARQRFGAVGDPWGLSLAHFGLGLAAARQGSLAGAKGHASEALALQATGGDAWNVGQILVLLGEVELRDGRAGRAAELLLESTEAFRGVGDRTSLAHVILCLAQCEAKRGRTLRAIRLAGAGRGLGERLDAPYLYALTTEADHQRTVDGLRDTAGKEAFAQEWAAGRAMSLDEAVAFALDDPERMAGRAPANRVSEARLRIFALGPPDVFMGRRRLRPQDWGYALPRELLLYLLLEGPRTKEQIGLEFWPEATKDQLRGRFRTALYQLRRALGGTEWVRYESGRYAFNRELDYWFDVEAFVEGIRETRQSSRSGPEEAAGSLQRAVDIYRGDLLEGEAPGRWASTHRDRLRRQYLEALLKLGELRTAEGSHEASARLYRKAIECDEFHEEAHRALARSMARAGDRAGALRHLDDLMKTLQSELGLDPSAETVELRSSLRRPLP